MRVGDVGARCGEEALAVCAWADGELFGAGGALEVGGGAA